MTGNETTLTVLSHTKFHFVPIISGNIIIDFIENDIQPSYKYISSFMTFSYMPCMILPSRIDNLFRIDQP